MARVDLNIRPQVMLLDGRMTCGERRNHKAVQIEGVKVWTEKEAW